MERFREVFIIPKHVLPRNHCIYFYDRGHSAKEGMEFHNNDNVPHPEDCNQSPLLIPLTLSLTL